MKAKHYIGLLLLVLGASCNPEVEVYAPEKELYAVYGVLNPNSPQQLVTVTKVFQSVGDASLYAATNDLTARGLKVVLKSDSAEIQATLIEIPDSLQGQFPLTTGVYRFATNGPDALKPGERYETDTDFTRRTLLFCRASNLHLPDDRLFRGGRGDIPARYGDWL
jgi:hypothetical protein